MVNLLIRGLVLLCFLFIKGSSLVQNSSRPAVVNIGSLFSFGTITGRVAKIAMNAAVDDVNADPSILGGSKLVLSTHDNNYSGFLGIIGGNFPYLWIFSHHMLHRFPCSCCDLVPVMPLS